MRVLIFVLALANLLFLAYAQGYFGRADNPDAVRVTKQVQPEAMQVVSRGEPPAPSAAKLVPPPLPEAATVTAVASDGGDTPATTAPAGETAAKEEQLAGTADKNQTICLAWPSLTASEADRLSALLSEKFDDFRQSRKLTPATSAAWWVFIPPQANKADADKKASELKKLGVSDFFVIQDSGPNRWAVSLGVFSAESGANGRLNELKAKGVRSAKVGPRNPRDAAQTFEARGPAERQAALQAAVAEVLAAAQSQACQP